MHIHSTHSHRHVQMCMWAYNINTDVSLLCEKLAVFNQRKVLLLASFSRRCLGHEICIITHAYTHARTNAHTSTHTSTHTHTHTHTQHAHARAARVHIYTNLYS